MSRHAALAWFALLGMEGVKVYDGRRRVPAATVRRELAEALAASP